MRLYVCWHHQGELAECYFIYFFEEKNLAHFTELLQLHKCKFEGDKVQQPSNNSCFPHFLFLPVYYDGFLNVEFRYRVTLKIVYLSHKQNIMNKRLFWFLKRIIPLRKWPPLVFFFENVHIFKKHFRVEFNMITVLLRRVK